MIRLENVTKTYNHGECKTEALRGIDLQIEQGEYIAVVGSSGSGKSTLLNILGGMDLLTSGTYYFDDLAIHNCKEQQLHEFRKNNISFVFQNFALMKQYTVYENIEIPLLAKGIVKKQRKEIIQHYMDLLGIAEQAKKRPSHISGGQQQRCAIARALASDNSVILADEPTGALDQRTGNEIMDVFEQINQMGKTLIIITHDPKVADRAKRIIKIEDGRIVEDN